METRRLAPGGGNLNRHRLTTMPDTTIFDRPSTLPALTPAPAVVAQLAPEENETPDVPQDPGASLEQNVSEPSGEDQPLPLSAIPVPAEGPASQNGDAPVFVPNQGAAFTPFTDVDEASIGGLEDAGGVLDATELGFETPETAAEDFLPFDVTETVTPPANQAPSASPQSLTTDEESAISGAVTATDPDGDALTFSWPAVRRQG